MKTFYQWEVTNDFHYAIVTLDIKGQDAIAFAKRYLIEYCNAKEHTLFGLRSKFLCSFVNNSVITIGAVRDEMRHLPESNS